MDIITHNINNLIHLRKVVFTVESTQTLKHLHDRNMLSILASFSVSSSFGPYLRV